MRENIKNLSYLSILVIVSFFLISCDAEKSTKLKKNSDRESVSEKTEEVNDEPLENFDQNLYVDKGEKEELFNAFETKAEDPDTSSAFESISNTVEKTPEVDYGLLPFEVDTQGLTKQKIILHYSHKGQAYSTFWVHDYLIRDGQFYFAVTDEAENIKGLLHVDKIDKKKTDKAAYTKLGKFARYIRAKATKKKAAVNPVVKSSAVSDKRTKLLAKIRKDAEWNTKQLDIRYATVTLKQNGKRFNCTFRKDILSKSAIHSRPLVRKIEVSGIISYSRTSNYYMLNGQRKNLDGDVLNEPRVYSKNEVRERAKYDSYYYGYDYGYSYSLIRGNWKTGWNLAPFSISLYSGADHVYYVDKEKAIQSRMEELKLIHKVK